MDEGVFRYEPDEDRWTPINVGLANEYINELMAVHSTLYAGTRDGVFRLTDDLWTRVGAGLEGKVVTALTSSGTALFAATWQGEIFRLDDSTASWRRVYSQSPTPRKSQSTGTAAMRPAGR